MATKLKIKKGDQVIVISGENKGEKGQVKSVNREKNTLIVENVNMITKHVKPNAKHPDGAREQVEGPIHISNVMLLAKGGVATRVGRRTSDNGKIVRYSKKSGEEIK